MTKFEQKKLDFLYEPLKKPDKEISSTWATSYGDLVTLLLVFFVILVSASQISATKLEKMKLIFQGESLKNTSLTKLLEDLDIILKKHGLADGVYVIQDEDGIKLVIKDSLLFRSGEANIPKGSQSKLDPIFAAFRELPTYYRFSIEGHTDDRPIHNAAFPSNWHLSASRSLAVLELFLAEDFPENRLSIRAFADQKPLVPNRDEENHALKENMQKNRRVVIRIR